MHIQKGLPHSLHTFTGDIAVDEVLDAVYIRNDTQFRTEDEVLLKFLRNYIQGCKQEGMYTFFVLIVKLKLPQFSEGPVT